MNETKLNIIKLYNARRDFHIYVYSFMAEIAIYKIDTITI